MKDGIKHLQMGIFETNQMLHERINLYNPLLHCLLNKCCLVIFHFTVSQLEKPLLRQIK